MFDTIRDLFRKPDTSIPALEPRLAAAVLLVHLAAVDGAIKESEREAVRRALQAHYGLDEDEVSRLIAEAMRRDAEAVDFYRFTSALKGIGEAEKLQVIRMMWQVVFSDGRNHELEDNMVWRIAELIGVSARDRTVLRSEMSRS